MTRPLPATPDPLQVLVVNAGSSSLKLSVVGGDGAVLDKCDLDRWDGSADSPPLRAFLDRLATSAPSGSQAIRPGAIGHRVVHGGSQLTSATLIDDAVLAEIDALSSLAPLHQQRALAGIAAASAAFPDLPQIACFDTAFHATMTSAAATYALPAAWRERFGLRKFGFHGLSHGYAARRAAQLLDNIDFEHFAVVTCHLGAGSSLAAVRGGRSVDTTMGFTPIDGLVMATRCGTVDPGLIMWLASAGRISLTELAHGLEHQSGLAGLAGLPGGTGDFREVQAAAERGEAGAVLAIGVHAHRLITAIGSMAAATNGIDALVFTGGIGENAPAVRAAAADGLAFLGVGVDPARNAAAFADADISADDATVSTLVVTAREDEEIARQARDVLGSA